MGFIPARVNGIFFDFRSHHSPSVDSASKINKYQGYLLMVKAAGV